MHARPTWLLANGTAGLIYWLPTSAHRHSRPQISMRSSCCGKANACGPPPTQPHTHTHFNTRKPHATHTPVAGPKKHALEMLRRKIEVENVAAAAVRRKRDDAKKVRGSLTLQRFQQLVGGWPACAWSACSAQ